VRRTLRASPPTVIGVGLLFGVGTALVPLLTDHGVLDHGKLTVSAPLMGEAKVTSALSFDTGVFLVVVGLVAMLLESFGGPDDDPRDEPVADPDAAGGDLPPGATSEGAP
jgi:hypothetical protein